MQKLFILLSTALFASVSFAAPVTNFIEFKPIAAVSNGYTFGVSEVQLNKRTVFPLSFKKGKTVFILTPENMLRGKYPNINFTGLAINKDVVIIGGKEEKSDASYIFMFNIEKDKVSLLDIISKAQINENIFNFDYQLPDINAPKSIDDLDKDKIEEFQLNFYDYGFNLYVELYQKRMKIDYNSPVYNNIFNELDYKTEKDDYQFMQYLIYGVLAKRLSKIQAEQMYLSHIRESDYKLKQIITNMNRIKELTDANKLHNQMMAYFVKDIEENELFSIINKLKNPKEYKQRIQLLDEQLKLLHVDEVILNDFATYIGGYISNKEFEEIVTKAAAPSYKNIRSLLSNILVLEGVLHRYGYKVTYIKADI